MESKIALKTHQLDFDHDSFVELMGQLTNIDGYKGSAIMTIEGELLYNNFRSQERKQHSASPEILDRLFSRACLQSEALGFLGCDQISIRTADELIVIRSSAKDCLVGVRLIVMFDCQSNEAMINLKLTKLLPKLMHSLTWNPDNLVRLFSPRAKGKIIVSH